MILYDHDCPNCGFREDVLQHSSKHDICPDCEAKVRVLIAAVPTHGIVFSNAETSKQLGVTWGSNKEKRDWFAKNPRVNTFEKGSQTDKDFKQGLDEKAEAAVQKGGFRDVQEFQSEGRKYKASEGLDSSPPK
jgi:hypothetical protein|tara:strand:- start:458 stop:856 length:399 start_codon:yes stop_codon:yes gene_type:complete